MSTKTDRQQRHEESPIEKPDHDDWDAEILDSGYAKVELNGVMFTFDCLTPGHKSGMGAIYAFSSDNHIHTKVRAVDVPSELTTWLNDNTGPFGNVEA